MSNKKKWETISQVISWKSNMYTLAVLPIFFGVGKILLSTAGEEGGRATWSRTALSAASSVGPALPCTHIPASFADAGNMAGAVQGTGRWR